MELRHLRYYVAVAEELNFRKAAERLNVSRPALSKQIKDLEEDISVSLLERDTVSVSLTKAGEIFLEDARSMLALADHAIARAHQAQSGQRGTLRIGSVGIIATDFLPRTLTLFHKKYPGVLVEFVEMLPAEQLAALAEGRIDIGFAYGPEIEKIRYLNSLRVIHSSFGVAISHHNPLANHTQLSLRDLRQETLLFLGGSGPNSHCEALCHIYSAAGAKPGKKRRIDGFDSMLTLLAADQGITLFPITMDLSKQGVSIIPLLEPKADLAFHMWAVWRKENPSAHVGCFIELLEERVRETIPFPGLRVS